MNSFFKSSFIWFLILAISAPSCASLKNNKPIKSNSVSTEELHRLKKVITQREAIVTNDVYLKIEEYKKYLKYGPPFPKEFWKLHDELFETYKALIHTNSGYKIVIPSKSQVNLTFRSFCLASSKAGPSNGENFKWVNKTPKIPYYNQLFTYWDIHPEISRHDIQTLIWNLGNKTYFENYPPRLQNILIEIDPDARSKLPSELRSQLFDLAKDLVLDSVPLARNAKNIYYDTKGSFNDYHRIARRIDEIKSKLPYVPVGGPTSIPGTPLYSDLTNRGFTEVTNPIQTQGYLNNWKNSYSRTFFGLVLASPL